MRRRIHCYKSIFIYFNFFYNTISIKTILHVIFSAIYFVHLKLFTFNNLKKYFSKNWAVKVSNTSITIFVVLKVFIKTVKKSISTITTLDLRTHYREGSLSSHLHFQQLVSDTLSRSSVISSSTVLANGLPRVSGNIAQNRPASRAKAPQRVVGPHQTIAPNKSAT